MTEVIDDSLSWEQRREMRRKKRQELLQEADNLGKPEKVTTSSRISNDDEDNFEQERARRRREREEKRKREREELEKQLKEEEEARAERERRREERRRQREEETVDTQTDTYSSSYLYQSTVTTTEKINDDSDAEEMVEETVSEVTEVISNGQDRLADQNGEDHQNGGNEEVEFMVEETSEVEEDNTHKTTYTSVTITSTKKSIEPQMSDGEDDDEEEKREQYEEESESSSDSANEAESEEKPIISHADTLQKRKMQREQERLEEERREEEERERRKLEFEAKKKAEREERERRMAEGEAKRREFKKQSSLDPQPLSTKGSTAASLEIKMRALNSRISDSPKTSKPIDTQVAKISSLDDRLKNYTNKAQKQESVRKTGPVTPKAADVASRLNMWESGKVTSADKTPRKVLDTAVVKKGAGVSSRKNMWETGQVSSGSSGEKRSARADIHGADFSSRKNMWLKATQESTKASSPVKPGDTQVIKTGVLSRLNKWEKGEVIGTPASTTKQKTNELPKSDVINRRSKWESIAQDSPNQTVSKNTTVRTMITTDVSNRKNLYENKTMMVEPKQDRRLFESGKTSKEVEKIQSEEEDNYHRPDSKRKDSISSYSGESDEHGLSESPSEDEKRHDRPTASETDESDQE